MKAAEVVIGANFGDEGKGLITSFFAKPHGAEALVVRFNGGAQAGHTVETGNNRRQIFSHIGSGSFTGADTFLSRFFVCNPLLFLKEHQQLAEQGVTPRVCVDPASPVTTPYDMMINQIIEETRGDARHGSCGLGFGETIERQQHRDSALAYQDLLDTNTLQEKLIAIRQNWLPKRLDDLGVTQIPPVWQDRIDSDILLENFMGDIGDFLSATTAVEKDFLAKTDQKIVFEGAQGLLLDQDRGWFPHVTRSHTGLRNALALAEEAGIQHLKVTYVTRAYCTRHGAGPLPHELPSAPYQKIEDKTNVTNTYQGPLRFAWLDIDLLAESIRKDLTDHFGNLLLDYGLAVTCLDQVDDQITFVHHDQHKKADHNAFLSKVKERTGAAFILTSHGSATENVSEGPA